METPWIASGKATLSSTLRCGSRAKFWNAVPTCAGGCRSSRAREASAGRGLRRTRLRPRSARSGATGSAAGWTCPSRERPMTMKISPSGTSRLTSRTAPTRPAAVERLGIGRCAAAVQKGLGVRAEQLPDMAAGQLHRVLAGAVDPSLLLRQCHLRCRPRPSTDQFVSDETGRQALRLPARRCAAIGGALLARPLLDLVLVRGDPGGRDLFERSCRRDRPCEISAFISAASSW